MLTLFFFEMFKVAFQPLYRHVHTEETSKRAETYNQSMRKQPHRFLIYYCYLCVIHEDALSL